MSDALSMDRPHEAPFGRTQGNPSREASRVRARVLIAQAERAVAEGGRGRDISNEPDDALIARYLQMGRGV